MADDLKRILGGIQRHVEKMQLVADFLKRHPQIAPRTRVKYFAGAVGLIVDHKALIKSEGVKSNALRLERWLEDSWSDLDREARCVTPDISAVSSDELEAILRTIPTPDDEDESDEPEEEESE